MLSHIAEHQFLLDFFSSKFCVNIAIYPCRILAIFYLPRANRVLMYTPISITELSSCIDFQRSFRKYPRQPCPLRYNDRCPHRQWMTHVIPFRKCGQYSGTITLTPYMVLPLLATRFADYAGGIWVPFIQPRLFQFDIKCSAWEIKSYRLIWMEFINMFSVYA